MVHVGQRKAAQGETNGIGGPFRLGGAAGGIASVSCPAPEVFHGSFFHLHGHRRLCRNWRQDDVARHFAGHAVPSALAIILGILAATLLNHALAAFAGQQVAGLLDAPWFRWAVALGFVAMALWTLVPDKIDDDAGEVSHKGSVFLTTTIAFFLVEMGDKTQIATVALGAQYQSVFMVAAGTTLGMMIANVPAVYLGEELVKRVPLNVMRWIAAGLFLALGVWQIWGLAV